MSVIWINKLNESTSRLHKEDVLKQALELATLGEYQAQVFLGLTTACYNPFVTFGVKQVQETQGLVNRENPWKEFHTLLLRLYERLVTGNQARLELEEISRRFDSDEWNGFCVLVIRKDLRAGISEKTLNKVFKNTKYAVPVFGCQLATNCEGRPEMSGKKRLEPKLDGVRVLLMVSIHPQAPANVICFSRNGKVFENFNSITEQVSLNISALVNSSGHKLALASGFVLDGEIMGQSFQDLMKQARRKENVQTDDSVLHVFDIIPMSDFNLGHWNMPQHRRMEILNNLRPVIDRIHNIELLPSIEVNLDLAEGHDQLNRYANDCVAAGFEGIMIKDLAAPYQCKRSTFWLKYKPVYDYDLKVIAVESGTGKNKDKMGALVCEGLDDGKFIHVNVGGGFSDEQRQSFWDDRDALIGQTAVVICDAVTKNQNNTYSLRFPRFKCFRDDK